MVVPARSRASWCLPRYIVIPGTFLPLLGDSSSRQLREGLSFQLLNQYRDNDQHQVQGALLPGGIGDALSPVFEASIGPGGTSFVPAFSTACGLT